MTGALELLEWIWANTERLRDLAVVLSAIAAVLGTLVAYIKISAYRSARQEFIAKDLYKSYLQLAVKHPELAYPAGREIDYKKCEFEGERLKFEKYEWFISYLLMTASEILKSKDRGWPALMQLEIWYHKRYFDEFDESKKRYLKHYPKNVRDLINKVRKHAESPSPSG